MTKRQEIDALLAFAASLPNDSYLKPWLQDVIPQIVQEITSDFPVSPSISETRKECSHMLDIAKANAEEIVKSAREQAEKIRKDADAKVTCLISRAAAASRNALHELERL